MFLRDRVIVSDIEWVNTLLSILCLPFFKIFDLLVFIIKLLKKFLGMVWNDTLDRLSKIFSVLVVAFIIFYIVQLLN